jgi:hypothetical protein
MKDFKWAVVTGEHLLAKVVGESMKLMFDELGYSVYNYTRWDERLAPKDWNSDMYGMPNTYYMTPQIDFIKEYK